jgi:hypothetical protein
VLRRQNEGETHVRKTDKFVLKYVEVRICEKMHSIRNNNSNQNLLFPICHFSLYTAQQCKKVIPVEALRVPGSWGSQIHDNRHMKAVKLSALYTGRLYPPGNIYGTHFYQSLCRPQGLSAAGMIMSMKHSNDTIGNRTCDLPACSAESVSKSWAAE